MNSETIAECMRLSFADTPFPVVVGELASAGVAAYTADLDRRCAKHTTSRRGKSDEAMRSPTSRHRSGLRAAVEASVRAIQQKTPAMRNFSVRSCGRVARATASSSAGAKRCIRPRGRFLYRTVPDGAKVNSDVACRRLG